MIHGGNSTLMQLIHHPLQTEKQIIKHALCALSNPGGEQQLKHLIAGVTLETNERKLNVKWEKEGFLWGIWVTSGLFREMSILQTAC